MIFKNNDDIIIYCELLGIISFNSQLICYTHNTKFK